MSVLIKGMEMPKSCKECRLCEGDTMDGLCHAVSKWFDDEYFLWYQYQEDDIDESKPINCPLIEVSTPHRRLIDADDLYDYAQDMYGGNAEDTVIWYGDLLEIIANAPTIIEAEVEE